MLGFDRSFRLTPATIAICYFVLSSTWILFSDRLAVTLIDDPSRVAWVQTAKGWFFVAVSALLLYVLVSRSQRELEQSNERLDAVVQQTSVLHRVLRHNLRNTCNVIRGTTERLQSGDDVDDAELLAIVADETDSLVELSEKTSQLRTLVLDERDHTAEIDLVSVVEASVDEARETTPGVEFRTELPRHASVEVHPRFALVVDELLENSLEHNAHDELRIDVSVRTVDGATVLEVVDTGGGLPEIEQDVLELNVERPMLHSEGLGLWIVRTIVTASGGEFRMVDNDPRGTVARVSVP
ncbi:HAMP domain-containing histidine kinase [Halobacteria archaeon AArc-m2/3/4]|uniref:histidine kinase n=1 Tax=Natronoglomus mannanivorans TaxID=2979990 RepID=A0AAP2YYH1_9EURY|nr:HAMP domain-containing histidine kinase [Halobacteria archaeon AArc-xg1-1]MCU4972428.1 HAMP domain-containing histidine kinase [Halobacteria archaeon AArc-m2/3/4]